MPYSLLLVVFWIGYAALGKNVFGKTPWPQSIVDFRLLYDYSKQIAAHQTYPPKHAYPPSAVALH